MNKEEQKNMGAVLLEALRLKSLSTEKLSQLTGISERFIELLLEERYEKLPPAPYLRGYLLKISDILNVDGERLWNEYLKSHEAMRRSGPKDILPPNRFKNPKIKNKRVAFILVIVLLLTYFAIQLPTMIGQPQIYLANLENNAVVGEASLTIKGRIKPSDSLTINAEEVYPGEKGEFTKVVKLNPGFNTFVFKVKRFLGKENLITRQIYYEPAKTTNN